MASTLNRHSPPGPWLAPRLPQPDASGLRAALLVSTPISLMLWAGILLLLGAI